MRRPAPDGPVVIAGGGIAGLATAALLAREGRDVTVVERRAETGGRMGSWSAAGFRFDTGPSWYLMPEVFEHFFRLLGTTTAEQLDLVRLDPGYRVYFEGERDPVDVRSGRTAAVELFESLEPGAGRALHAYLDSARRTYDLALRRFLYTDFRSYLPLVRPDVLARGGEMLARLVEPLHSFISRRFRDPRLRQILGYPAVFLGSSPYTTPSLYHLMSRLDLDDGVYYPRGGFVEVAGAVRRLAEAEGVRVLTGTEVVSLCTEYRSTRSGPRARVTGVVVRDAIQGDGAGGDDRKLGGGDDDGDGKGDGNDDEVRTLDADLVVGAADLAGLEPRWLPEHLQTYPEQYWRGRTPGPGALVLLLGVRGALPELAHHTLLFTREWEAGFDAIFGDAPHVPDPASLYICRPTATENADTARTDTARTDTARTDTAPTDTARTDTAPTATEPADSTVAPEGHENLFVLVPVPADTSAGHGGVAGAGTAEVEAAADRAIRQIADWTGVADLAERVVVRRVVAPADFERDLGAWRGTALGPAHTLGQSAFLRTRNRSRHVDGLVYAGSSTIPGIGLPMCLISAELVLKHIRGDTGTAPVAEPGGGTNFDG